MDFQLTGQQRRMVTAVRDLAQGEFKANAQKYMDGTFPWENMKKLAEIGVLGMSVPKNMAGSACRSSIRHSCSRRSQKPVT
jgi:alkylation response protein AidB-like acyl-CoA dehydrogenase